jgi:hypothetical protein
MFVAALAGAALGQKAGLAGQASGWLAFTRDTSNQAQAGVRYIPSLSLSLPPRLDAELSVNAFASAQARSLDSIDANAKVKPYRLWARFSTPRFEARAGLQKINFGSATLLRPLMWFDRIDPRDPLALTDGVYALLGRYYFQNNANFWAWGLLGNSAPKGWEAFGSSRWVPEFGGRVQVPVPRGEVAATYHHRVIDYSGITRIPEFLPEQDEDRLGLDAKVDVGVGFWLEGTLSRETRRMDYGDKPPLWTHAAAAGADYTFGLGSGLGVIAEHMLAGSADEPFGRGADAQFSALAVSYPLGLLDNLRAIVYFDWTNRDLYSFLGWQRTTDNWMFSLSAFANPDRPAATGRTGGAAGKGVRFDVVFNH